MKEAIQDWPDIMHHIVMIARRVFKRISAQCIKNNISIPQHHILIECLRLGGHCSQEELVQILLFNKGTISRGIHNLENLGFLTIYHDEENHSFQSVRLTDVGIDYAKENVYASVCGLEWIERNFTPHQHEALISYLSRFYSQINPLAHYEHFPETWPLPIHFILNIVKHMENNSDLFRKDGREANQKHILLHLIYQDGQATFKETEKALFVAQSVIVRQMKKLEDKGMVECFLDEEDKRVKIARLTSIGYEEAQKVYDVFQENEQLGCTTFSDSEKSEFKGLLELLLCNMEKDVR